MCGVHVFGHNKRREAKWARVWPEPDLSKKKFESRMDSACRAPSVLQGSNKDCPKAQGEHNRRSGLLE